MTKPESEYKPESVPRGTGLFDAAAKAIFGRKKKNEDKLRDLDKELTPSQRKRGY